MDRNRSLDGARGLAALSVALAHCATTVGGIAIYAVTFNSMNGMPRDAVMLRFWHSVFNGDAAVILFFTLSGYVLGRSLEREDCATSAFLPYAIKRAFRLLPATIVAGLLAYALEPISVRQMIGAMLIYDDSANGVLWSLQVEVIGSALIFALWAMRSRILVLVLLVFYASAYRNIPQFLLLVRSEFTLLPAAFVLGYAAPWIRASEWRPAAIGLVGLAMLLLSDLFMGRTWDARMSQVVGAFLVVGYLQANPLRFLGTRGVQFLGDVSYSFYLVHPLLLERSFGVLTRLHMRGPLPLQAVMLAACTIPPAMLVAWLMSNYVEKPGIRAGKSVINRFRSPLPPTTA